MKFRSLHLKNFQAHKDLALEFSPTLTTIKGPTDKGKSAILRALRWACLNDLTGEGFITEGEKKTTVEVLVVHKKARYGLVRSKSVGGNTNTYSLGGEEFKAFGQGVPTDIRQLLRVNEINFQAQHDTPFWFSETAGEVSRRLNAVIDLTVIDYALSSVASEVRKSQERKSVCEERLKALKDELEALGIQKERIEDFERLLKKNEESKKANKHQDRLATILLSIRECRRAEREQQAQEGEALLAQAGELLKLSRREGNLRDILLRLRELGPKAQPPPAIDSVEEFFKEWTKKDSRHARLEELLYQIESAQSSVETKSKRLAAAIQNFLDKTKGKNCPTCGNKIIDLHYE